MDYPTFISLLENALEARLSLFDARNKRSPTVPRYFPGITRHYSPRSVVEWEGRCGRSPADEAAFRLFNGFTEGDPFPASPKSELKTNDTHFCFVVRIWGRCHGVTERGGETRFTTGTMYTDKLYTGQREMAGLGIYHYNARFYSPKLGRFLSADTIVPGFANPQNLNRYSYVGNSPLNYIDPSGHMRLAEGPQDDDFSQSDFDDYVPLPDNDDDDDDEENDLANILDPTQNDDDALPIPTMENNLQADDSSNTFWAAASASGDIAFGGFFTSLSVYALIASCVYAGPACLITAPIFFTTAVIGAQVFVNGVQSFRQMNDSSIKPTGREVIDLVFPFLKKEVNNGGFP